MEISRAEFIRAAAISAAATGLASCAPTATPTVETTPIPPREATPVPIPTWECEAGTNTFTRAYIDRLMELIKRVNDPLANQSVEFLRRVLDEPQALGQEVFGHLSSQEDHQLQVTHLPLQGRYALLHFDVDFGETGEISATAMLRPGGLGAGDYPLQKIQSISTKKIAISSDLAFNSQIIHALMVCKEASFFAIAPYSISLTRQFFEVSYEVPEEVSDIELWANLQRVEFVVLIHDVMAFYNIMPLSRYILDQDPELTEEIRGIRMALKYSLDQHTKDLVSEGFLVQTDNGHYQWAEGYTPDHTDVLNRLGDIFFGVKVGDVINEHNQSNHLELLQQFTSINHLLEHLRSKYPHLTTRPGTYTRREIGLKLLGIRV